MLPNFQLTRQLDTISVFYAVNNYGWIWCRWAKLQK